VTSYLVRLVVVLRVVREQLLLLRVFPVGDRLVQLGLLTPVFAFNEPRDIVSLRRNRKPCMYSPLSRCGGRELCLYVVCGVGCSSHLLGQIDVKLSGSQESQLHRMPLSVMITQTDGLWEKREFKVHDTGAVISIRRVAYHGQGVQALSKPFALEHHAELEHLRLLAFGEVPRVATLRRNSRQGKVIVVVLGVELELTGLNGSGVDHDAGSEMVR
jgi:hypothetical protein